MDRVERFVVPASIMKNIQNGTNHLICNFPRFLRKLLSYMMSNVLGSKILVLMFLSWNSFCMFFFINWMKPVSNWFSYNSINSFILFWSDLSSIILVYMEMKNLGTTKLSIITTSLLYTSMKGVFLVIFLHVLWYTHNTIGMH